MTRSTDGPVEWVTDYLRQHVPLPVNAAALRDVSDSDLARLLPPPDDMEDASDVGEWLRKRAL
jgi:hypothetical protein